MNNLGLTNHRVSTAYQLGWGELKNGELLLHAENSGFEVLITTDKNLRYQQNLATTIIAIVVLTTTSWPRIQKHTKVIEMALTSATPSSYVEIDIL
jgi:hypothetical protein